MATREEIEGQGLIAFIGNLSQAQHTFLMGFVATGLAVNGYITREELEEALTLIKVFDDPA